MSRVLPAGAGLLALLLLSPATFADDALVKESATSEISVRPADGNFEVTTVNRRFETDTLASTTGGPDDLIYQLLLIEETHVGREGPQTDAEPVSGTVKVTAFPLGAKGKGAARFTIEAKGDEARADGPYLTITRWGCCAELPAHAVYSLESGAYLFNATGDGDSGQWATLGAQGGWAFERIVAYHTAETEADDEVLKGAPNAVIAITYATTTRPLQRILVTAPKEVASDDAVLNWTPKLDLVSKAEPDGTDRVFVDRKGEPAALFTDVTARLTLDGNTRIEIPLVDDRLKPDGARLPPGYALIEVQP